MKLLVVFCLVATALAAPPGNSGNVEVLHVENDNIGTGPFQFGYELSDGSKVDVSGDLKSGGPDNAGFEVINGGYEYVGSDGVKYSVTYEADENGFHPHLAQGAGGAISDLVIKNFQ